MNEEKIRWGRVAAAYVITVPIPILLSKAGMEPKQWLGLLATWFFGISIAVTYLAGEPIPVGSHPYEKPGPYSAPGRIVAFIIGLACLWVSLTIACTGYAPLQQVPSA